MRFVPGRIEFLGKHTDYCGGESLVCAIDRGFRFAVVPRQDSQVRIRDLNSGESASFDLRDSVATRGWANYAVEVARRVRMNFGEAVDRGIDLEFRNDLPSAAGLSSSSALMIMVAGALDEANGFTDTEIFRRNVTDDLELADFLGCVENGKSFRELAGSAGVGTFGGSQDHAAIIGGRAGHLTRFSFCPTTRVSEVRFPEGLSFVVGSSGISAAKTGDARDRYNRMSRMAAEIVSVFGASSLAELLREIDIDELGRRLASESTSFPAEDLMTRAEQFRLESFEIVPQAEEALATGNYRFLGELVDRSQRAAETLLGNQTDETIYLQRSARRFGAIAASAFGAGFGGSVYAVVETDVASEFRTRWESDYRSRYPYLNRAKFFVTSVVSGTRGRK